MTAITLTIILAISMHSAIVLAKGKPPKTVRETAPFRIWVGKDSVGDIVLLETVEKYPDHGTLWFDVTTYVDDWDYTGGVAGGEPREKYRWGYYDGGGGFPFIAFGKFAINNVNDVFTVNGFDWRPDDGIAELMWIDHWVSVEGERDYWLIYLNWTETFEGRDVNVQLFGRTNLNAEAEGEPSGHEIDGTVDTWEVSFTQTSEFKLQYSYFDTIQEPIGKSGRVREVTKYIKEVIWDYGEIQPSLTVTVTIERLLE